MKTTSQPSITILQLTVILTFALAAAVCHAQSSAAEMEMAAQMDAGHQFTQEQLSAAEKKLQADPKNLDTRLQLLGYYMPEGKSSAQKMEAWKHFAPLALGIIENNPQSDLAGRAGQFLIARYYELPDQGDWEKGVALWDKVIAANPTNAQIIGQAATCLSANMFSPQTRATELLEKAGQLDPTNPKWPRLLGQIYAMRADDSPETAGKALAALEHAASLSTNSPTAEDCVSLAGAAALAKRWDKVIQYGTNALARIDSAKGGWNYGNMIHDVNGQLCVAALHEGDKKLAGEFLLAAGRSTGSPQLSSFGPDFSYAAAMPRAGGTNVVLQYLDLVGNFWGNTNRNAGSRNANSIRVDQDNAHDLEKYKQQIRDGKMPDERMWSRSSN